MYRPVWSAAILAELEYHEARKLARRQAMDQTTALARATRLVSRMRSAFDDAEVTGWEPLEGTYGLPDPDDEHVVAGAGAIVTSNLRHFPRDKVPDTIDVLAPAKFAVNTVVLNAHAARCAVAQIAARSGQYGCQLSIDEVLDLLGARYGMSEAVEHLR